MNVLPLHPEIAEYARRRQLAKKLERQISAFARNPFHPSLHTELLEPKRMRLWSFRIDRKYRAIFIFRGKDAVEVLDINNHYGP